MASGVKKARLAARATTSRPTMGRVNLLSRAGLGRQDTCMQTRSEIASCECSSATVSGPDVPTLRASPARALTASS